jgi:hypothetical protein
MMYQEVDRSDPRKLKNSVDSLPDENSQNHTHHLKKKKKNHTLCLHHFSVAIKLRIYENKAIYQLTQEL